MLSVEQLHPAFAQRCHYLGEGESAYSGRPEIPYDVHCYRDGWYIYWKSPPNGHIGRRLRTSKELLIFLSGNWKVGTVLRSTHLNRKR